MSNDRPILTEDELALRVGRLTFLWNDIHFFVYTMFVRLMGGDYRRADAIFFGLRSDNLQRRVTDRLSQEVLSAHPETKDRISSYLKEINKLADRRNAFIHAMWASRHRGQPEVFEPSQPKLAQKDVKVELDNLIYICVHLADDGADLDMVVEKTMKTRLSLERLAKAFPAGSALEEPTQAMADQQNHLNSLLDYQKLYL